MIRRFSRLVICVIPTYNWIYPRGHRPHEHERGRALKKNTFLSIPLVISVIVIALLAGCMPHMPRLPVTGENTAGSIRLMATAPKAMEYEQFSDVKVTFSLGNDRSQRILFLDRSATEFFGQMDIAVGDWDVTIHFYDLEGDIIYSGEEKAYVRAGEETIVHMEATPHRGYLEVEVDISSAYTEDEVDRVRIELPTNHRTTLTVSETNPTLFTGRREFPPGHHDFSIVLYKGGESSTHRVYPGPWEQVRIMPGKTIFVTWSPGTGSTHIETRTIDMPEPPSGLELAYTGENEMMLLWHPSPASDVDFYRVYLKKGDLGHFASVAEIDNDNWEIDPKLLVGLDTFSFAVTAVNEHGQESFRTEPLKHDVALD